ARPLDAPARLKNDAATGHSPRGKEMRARPGFIAAVLAGAFAASLAFGDDTPKPKFGPEATPIFADNAYLRQSPAPDYWNLSPFYIPQRTSSDCSLAAIAMVVNALRGLPKNADQELVNGNNLMAAVNDQGWMVKVTEDGPGVTFA